MSKENNKVDINKHEIDIDTLFKQNVNDLSAIKELYKRIEELGEKITQVKYIDNTLVKKIKKEYENFKKIILDENVQVKLTHDIETINSHNSQLTNDIKTINSQLDTNVRDLNIKINEVATTGTTTEVVQNKVSEMAQNGSILFNTITPKMTTFFEQSGNNLFIDKTYRNKTIHINGSYFTGNNYESYCASEKNKVDKLTTYNINNGNQFITAQCISFLSLDGSFIEQLTGGVSQFTTPENCSYVILSFLNSDVNSFEDLAIQKGTVIEKIHHYFNGELREQYIKTENLSLELQEKINVKSQQLDIISSVNDEFKNKTAIIGKYLNPETNILGDNDNFTTSEIINCDGGQDYIFDRNDYKISQSGSTTFYDADGHYISGIYSYEKLTTPVNCKSFRISVHQATQEDFNNLILIKGNKLKPISKARPTTLHEGKKWTVIGDSWTEKNYRTSLNYHDYVASELGFNVVNLGIGGTGYKNRDSEGNMAFYQRVNEIPLDTDIITILGGVNDCLFATNTPVGEITDNDKTTLCGCVNLTIDAILDRLPCARLGIITPAASDKFNPISDNKMEQFVSKLIEICKKRSIPCLDLYHTSNLRPWITEVNKILFSCGDSPDGDGLHPNHIGHRDYIAPKVKEFVKLL